MAVISSLLPWIHIVLALSLIGLILLQQNESSLGGVFGGADSAGHTHKRRGLEKIIFDATFVVAVLFTGSVLLAIVI
ncbi:MAG: preprotein translocase subunit SecG [Candidatus Paceibacterota bacterium]